MSITQVRCMISINKRTSVSHSENLFVQNWTACGSVVSHFHFSLKTFIARRFIMEWGKTFSKHSPTTVSFLAFCQHKFRGHETTCGSFKMFSSRVFLICFIKIHFNRFLKSCTKLSNLITICLCSSYGYTQIDRALPCRFNLE